MSSKKLAYFFLFFLAFYLISLIALKEYYEKKLAKLSAEKKTLQEDLKRQSQPPNVSLNDIFLLAKKNKLVNQAKKGQMYFSAKTNKLGKDEWLVIIMLEGDPESIADASDLRLDLDGSIETADLTTGDAFPLYPRKVTSNNAVLITGITSINKSNITFGSAGKTFVTLKVKKTQVLKVPAKISIDPKETAIYLNAENILDQTKNFKEILLY